MHWIQASRFKGKRAKIFPYFKPLPFSPGLFQPSYFTLEPLFDLTDNISVFNPTCIITPKIKRESLWSASRARLNHFQFDPESTTPWQLLGFCQKRSSVHKLLAFSDQQEPGINQSHCWNRDSRDA